MNTHTQTNLAEIMLATNESNGQQYIVCFGAPFDEQHFVGPFQTFDDASEYADNNPSDYTWIVTLNHPENEEQSNV